MPCVILALALHVETRALILLSRRGLYLLLPSRHAWQIQAYPEVWYFPCYPTVSSSSILLYISSEIEQESELSSLLDFLAFFKQEALLQIYAPLPFFFPVRSSITSPSGVLITLISVFLGKCSPQPEHLLIGILRSDELTAIVLRLNVYLAACKTCNKLCVLSLTSYSK